MFRSVRNCQIPNKHVILKGNSQKETVQSHVEHPHENSVYCAENAIVAVLTVAQVQEGRNVRITP